MRRPLLCDRLDIIEVSQVQLLLLIFITTINGSNSSKDHLSLNKAFGHGTLILRGSPGCHTGKRESVAQKLREKIDSKVFAIFYAPERIAQRGTDNRRKNVERYGFTNREYWNGHDVKFHQNGWVRLYVSADMSALKFWTPKKVFDAIEESAGSAVITFLKEGLLSKLEGCVIFQKSQQQLSQMRIQGNRWAEQIDKELVQLGSETGGQSL